ncbi:MAG: hypothetical protein DCF22_03885 [Leptolyngbya sp.]|nr:MAG: hypothetical protein DCF22_03885 [Leptolyngbya sp.]
MNLSTGNHAQTPTIKRFTLEEYHRLGELGFFAQGDRIELIRGELVYMAAKGTAHEACNRKLIRELPKLIGDRATLQDQSPVVMPTDGAPEPDFAVVKNRDDDYVSIHPTPEDVLLLIEISDSSLTYDQETKLSLYAENNIQDYWIFNLLENVLETYSEPYQRFQGDFGYRIKRVSLPNEAISLPHFPDLILDLSKTFPAKITP